MVTVSPQSGAKRNTPRAPASLPPPARALRFPECMDRPPPTDATSNLTWLSSNFPCRAACPVGTNAGGYVSLIAEGRYQDAYLLARRPNPMASICGWICAAACFEAGFPWRFSIMQAADWRFLPICWMSGSTFLME